MSSDLHSGDTETSFSSTQRKVAIATIVLFSLIHLVQIPARYKQEWRYWHHNKRKNPARCFVYAWWSMIGLLAQIRIAGSAMVLSNSHPSSEMLITVSIMQSTGLSLLLLELSLVLLRSGQAGECGPGLSKYSSTMRFAVHFFRFQIFVAILIDIGGGCTESRPLRDAALIVLVFTFAYLCGLVIWLAKKTRSNHPVAGHRGLVLILFALPSLLVRIVYFLQLDYNPAKLGSPSSDDDARAEMGLVLEVCIVILLLAARAEVEPIWPAEIQGNVGVKDEEMAA